MQTVEVLENKVVIINDEIVISQEAFFLLLLCSCSLSCCLEWCDSDPLHLPLTGWSEQLEIHLLHSQ